MTVRVLHGDCLVHMKRLHDEGVKVDAVCTDPPYNLTSIAKRFGKQNSAPAQYGADGSYARLSKGFMNAAWDTDIAFQANTWELALNLLKPGAFMVAFASTRGYHRMVCAIEDAGFVIHPMLGWIFASGFPKATSFQIEGMEGWRYGLQALKPALEPICLAQKPLEGTGTNNWLKHGVGGINIDACRVESGPGDNPVKWDTPRGGIWSTDSTATGSLIENAAGRWPANLCHDGSDEVMAAFEAFGDHRDGGGKDSRGNTHLAFSQDAPRKAVRNDIHTGHGNATGSAARFFFCGKADADDRAGSKHPTVKPLSLMTWLVRLITPLGGTVLDPFAGSGTTLLAADRLQLNAIGIEQSAEYVADIHRRLRSDAPLFADAAQ